MTRLKICSLLLSLLLLAACKNDPLDGRNDPKDDSWNMTFEGPAYMQGWVELRAVEDINGRLMSWQGGGGIGGDEPGLDKEYARGWGSVGGSIFPMTGAEGVRNFVFGHNMSKRCMYANQKETRAAEAPCNPKGAA